jgi:hypothetical protein
VAVRRSKALVCDRILAGVSGSTSAEVVQRLSLAKFVRCQVEFSAKF